MAVQMADNTVSCSCILKVLNKVIFIASLMGNNGTFTKPVRVIVNDVETLYHFLLLGICLAGLCVHPFFYSLLVSGGYRKYSLHSSHYCHL